MLRAVISTPSPFHSKVHVQLRISITLSLLFLTVSAAAAHAHASLTQASPSVGSTMSVAPHEVILTFTERLEAAFSKLTVTEGRH